MFIEGKRKRKGIANRIVKIYRYKVPSRNRTYNIIYKSTTKSDGERRKLRSERSRKRSRRSTLS
jgi:hypothetical protein